MSEPRRPQKPIKGTFTIDPETVGPETVPPQPAARSEHRPPAATSFVHVKVDNQNVAVPVSERLFTFFQSQFTNTTTNQKNRRSTLFQLMAAAYQKGLEDGRK